MSTYITCPNTNTEEWKNAVKTLGVDGALSQWISGVPSVETPEYKQLLSKLRKILPPSIGINIVESIAKNPDSIGITLNGAISLTNQGLDKAEYHEAFHAVYRFLMSKDERDSYSQLAYQELIKIAKTNGTSLAQMIREKQQEGYFQGQTIQEALPTFIEEWLSDQFQKYMSRPAKSTNWLGQLFEKIKSFIKSLVSRKQDLDLLFKNIEDGAYRNASVSQEDYYNIPAFKLLSKAVRGTSEEDAFSPSFGANETNEIIREIATYYYEFKQSKMAIDQKWTDSQIIEKILNLKKDFYSGYANVDPNLNIPEHDYYYLYSNEDTEVDGEIILGERTILKIEVMKYLKNFKRLNELSKEGDDEAVDDVGDKTYLNAEMKPELGWGSIPQFVREFIASVSYETGKKLGTRKDIVDGQLVDIDVMEKKSVNPTKVYNGLLRALANEFSEKAMVEKLLNYGELVEYYDANGNLTTDGSNKDTFYFVQHFLKKTKLDVDKLKNNDPEGFLPHNDADAHLIYRKVIQGFNRWAKDTLFTQFDSESKESIVYLANRKNVAQRQLSEWHNNFKNSEPNYNEISQDLGAILPLFGIDAPFYRDIKAGEDYSHDMTRKEQLARDIGKVRTTMLKLGIDLSPNFIKYSLLHYRMERLEEKGLELGEDTLTEKEYGFLKSTRIPEKSRITVNFITQIKQIVARGDTPYEYKDGETFQNNSAGISKITDLAKGNALLDESVFESSYVAADGTTRYLHQDGTYHLKAIAKLRDEEFINQLMQTGIRDPRIIVGTNPQTGEDINIDDEDKDFVINNFLLSKDSDFLRMHKSLRIRELDGIKQVRTIYVEDEWDSEGNPIVDSIESSDGVHFGEMSDRDFAVTLLNLYSTPEFEIDDNNKHVFVVPQIISVMETSKSSDYAYLPVIPKLATEDGQASKKAVDLFTNEILKELRRIQRVSKQILNEKGENKDYDTINKELGFVIDEYHTKGRALKITDKLSSLLSTTGAKFYEQAAIKAKTPEDLEKLVDSINTDVKHGLNHLVNKTIDKYEELQIIEREAIEDTIIDDAGNSVKVVVGRSIKSKFLSENYTKEDENLGFTKSIEHNLSQVILQQFLNTLALSHLIHGDNALMYKNDNKDPYKREKPNNAKIVKFKHKDVIPKLGVTEFEYSNILIIEEPKGDSKLFPKEKISDGIDIADAQMWCSIKAKRNYLHGLGRLTPQIAAILDKMEKGIPLSSDELFTMDDKVLDQDRFINSDKLVFKDSKRTVKMSVVPLTKQLTSYYSPKDKKWKALPGREALHDMREHMEAEGVDFVAPKSAFKTYRSNILRASDENKSTYNYSEARPQLYDNEYFGLQMENPTNKTKITVPTQLLHSIDAEQKLDVMANVLGQDEPKTIEQIVTDFNNALSNKFENNFIAASAEMYQRDELSADVEELIQTGNIRPRLAHFQKKALSGLEASGADPQLLEFFEVGENGVPKYNLNNDLVLEKYMQLYLAHFTKGTFSAKTPGHSVALFSNYGMKLMKRVVAINDGQVVWENIKTGSPEYINLADNATIKTPNWTKRQEGQNVSYRDPNLSVGDVFIDAPAYNVPEWKNGKITGYFSEMIMPYQTKEMADNIAGGKIPEEVAYMFANRIPLQDKHSMLAIKWVDTMPLEYGSTAVFPSEIIELSGADFDIDKAYITRFDTYFKDGKFYRYGERETKDAQYNEYLKWNMKYNTYLKSLVDEKKKTDPRQKALTDYINKLKKDIKTIVKSKEYDTSKKAKELQDLLDSITGTDMNEDGDMYSTYQPDYDENEIDREAKNRLQDVDRFNALTATVEQYQQEMENIKHVASDLEYDLLLEAMAEYAPEMPRDYDTFSQAYNIGYNNNVVLKSMLALLTNDYVRNGIADQPATQDYLASGGNPDGSKKMNPAFILDNEDGTKTELFGDPEYFPIDSMLSHINVKTKNNIGKDNIGIDVSGNVQNSIFKKAGIQLRPTKQIRPVRIYQDIDYDNIAANVRFHSFRDLSVYNEFDFKTMSYTGKRTMDSTSTKISSSTDEAKDGNNAKFNLGKEQSKLISVGNGLLGIPLEFMLTFVNQPVLKNFLDSSSKEGIRTEEEKKYRDVEAQLKAIKESGKNVREARAALEEELKGKVGDFNKFFNFKSLVQLQAGRRILPESFSAIENKVIEDFVNEKILDNFDYMSKLADARSKVGDILKLNKGLKDFNVVDKALVSAFELGLIDGQLDKKIPFDLRGVFGVKNAPTPSKYQHTVSKSYLKRLAELNKLSKLNFVHKTGFARDVTKRITSGWYIMTNEDKKNLEKDFLSFTSISAYKTLLKQFDIESDTMTNALLVGNHDATITSIYKKIKTLAPNNAISKYIITSPKQVLLSTGQPAMFNMLEANSFTKLNDIQLGALINGFIELYQDDKTKNYAQALFDYIVVKDAIQFKNKSISKIFPAEMFSRITVSTNLAHGVLLASNKKGLITAMNNINLELGDTPLFSEEEIERMSDVNFSFRDARDMLFKRTFGMDMEEFYNTFSHLVYTQPAYKNKATRVNTSLEGIVKEFGALITIDLDYNSVDEGMAYAAGLDKTKENVVIYPQFIKSSSNKKIYRIVSVDNRINPEGLNLPIYSEKYQDDVAFLGFKAVYHMVESNDNPQWNQMANLGNTKVNQGIVFDPNGQIVTKIERAPEFAPDDFGPGSGTSSNEDDEFDGEFDEDFDDDNDVFKIPQTKPTESPVTKVEVPVQSQPQPSGFDIFGADDSFDSGEDDGDMYYGKPDVNESDSNPFTNNTNTKDNLNRCD